MIFVCAHVNRSGTRTCPWPLAGLAVLCLAGSLFGADVTVGVDYPDIQAAFDKAPCGSRILIPPGTYTVNGGAIFRQNCAASPMFVTTSMHAWLPRPGTRITPSYVYGAGGPVLPVIQSQAKANTPSMMSGLDGLGNPANNWTFLGLVFQPAAPGNTVTSLCPAGSMFNSIITVGGGSGWPYSATSAAQQPEKIVFDRIIVRGGLGRAANTVCVVSGIRTGVRSGTVANSFIHDIIHEYQDTFALGTSNGGSNITIYNNYLNAGSETAFISSGGPGDYADPAYLNWDAEFNYIVKSWKWWGGDIPCAEHCAHQVNPHGPAATAAGHPEDDWITGYGVELNSTLKNLLEFKSINGAIVKYNVGELSPGKYMGQNYGLCATPRSSGQRYDNIPSKDPSGTVYTLTTTAGAKSFSWTGKPAVFASWKNDGPPRTWAGGIPWPLKVGTGICRIIRLPGAKTDGTTAWECRKIASVDNSANVGTVTTDWASGGTTNFFATLQDVGYFKDVTFESNVFKNVAIPWQFLGTTPASDQDVAAGGGRMTNFTIRNNLVVNTIPLKGAGIGHFLTQDNVDSNQGPQTSSVQGLIFEHNTHYNIAADKPAYLFDLTSNPHEGGVNSAIAVVSGARINNNLFPDTTWGWTGAGWFGASRQAINTIFGTDLVMQNNQQTADNKSFADTDCKDGRKCSGNITTVPYDPANFVDAAKGNYRVRPGTPWAKAGTDGKDLGADIEKLPLLNNVKVKAGAREATIDFDLSAVNASIPVVLEVSSTRATFGKQWYPCLPSTLCPYTVVPSLDPTLFKQPDSSERTNAKLPPVAKNGLHRSWPVCWSQRINDDRTGAARDLSCEPNTTYYYRIMAGGDTVWGSFTTTAP